MSAVNLALLLVRTHENTRMPAQTSAEHFLLHIVRARAQKRLHTVFWRTLREREKVAQTLFNCGVLRVGFSHNGSWCEFCVLARKMITRNWHRYEQSIASRRLILSDAGIILCIKYVSTAVE